MKRAAFSRAAALCLAATAALSSPASAVIENPDLDTEGSYVFTADPETGTVTVTVDIAVTGDKPDSANYYYYFTGVALALPEEVENLTVTNSSGRELSYEVDDSYEGYRFLDVSFGHNLRYRRTTHILLSYELPAGVARDEGWVRVNDAYIGFPVVIDPLLESASVEVHTPSLYLNDDFLFWQKEETEDGLIFSEDEIDPETYFRFISLRNEYRLDTTTLEVDGAEFEIRSWPGDDEWTDHVESSITDGLAPLSEAVGLDWPLEDPLVVEESFSPYLLGYGGWYDPDEGTIEIGDELDQELVFHELSHVWLNSDLYEERWITEGLADFFAAETMEAIGEDRPEPPRSSPNDEFAQELDGWTRLERSPDVEEWSYGAAWTVTEELAAEVGVEGLRAAVVAAANGASAYPGDVDATVEADTDADVDVDTESDDAGFVPASDWKAYLDHLQNAPDADDEAIREIFEEWVLPTSMERSLDERDEARAAYDELVAAGDLDGTWWAPPAGVREVMDGWEFARAEHLIGQSTDLLAVRDEMVEVLAPLGAELPDDLEAAYEDTTRPEFVADRFDEALASAERLAEVGDDLEAATGLLARVGRIGSDAELTLESAVDAFETADDETALDLADDVAAEVDDYATQGRNRLAAVGAALVALVGGVVLLKRRRRPAEPATSAPEDGEDVPPAETIEEPEVVGAPA